jgi:hypothetical protein
VCQSFIRRKSGGRDVGGVAALWVGGDDGVVAAAGVVLEVWRGRGGGGRGGCGGCGGVLWGLVAAVAAVTAVAGCCGVSWRLWRLWRRRRGRGGVTRGVMLTGGVL